MTRFMWGKNRKCWLRKNKERGWLTGENVNFKLSGEVVLL
jgi:hypothetical protein